MQSAELITIGAVGTALLAAYTFQFMRVFCALGHSALCFRLLSFMGSDIELTVFITAVIGIFSYSFLERIQERDYYLVILLFIVALIGLFLVPFELGPISIPQPSFQLSLIFKGVRL